MTLLPPSRHALCVIAILLGAVSRAFALPDLVPEIYAVQIQTAQSVPAGDVADGCAASADGRTLVRFGVRTWNIAAVDALDIGDPGCPQCTASNPGASCANPEFQCSLSGVPRVVFLSSARYELLDAAGNVLAIGAKRNYCFNDDGCNPPAQPTFTDCANEGVSAGCYDDYEPALSCQYIDATAIPDVTTRALRIRVTIDPENLLLDADRSNNVSEAVIPGCGDGIVQPGEECDAGACCDSSCHLLSPATICRPATGPCDVPEACDGASPDCPVDAQQPDGMTCGVGAPPCVQQVCRAGQCVTENQSTGCLVSDTCLAPGAPNPDNPCERCEPALRTDGFSPDVDPDMTGMRCQLDRIAAAPLSGCPRPVVRTITTYVGRAGRVLEVSPRNARDARRLQARLAALSARLARVLGRVAQRPGCETADAAAQVQTLLGQIRAFTATGS